MNYKKPTVTAQELQKQEPIHFYRLLKLCTSTV